MNEEEVESKRCPAASSEKLLFVPPSRRKSNPGSCRDKNLKELLAGNPARSTSLAPFRPNHLQSVTDLRKAGQRFSTTHAVQLLEAESLLTFKSKLCFQIQVTQIPLAPEGIANHPQKAVLDSSKRTKLLNKN